MCTAYGSFSPAVWFNTCRSVMTPSDRQATSGREAARGSSSESLPELMWAAIATAVTGLMAQ